MVSTRNNRYKFSDGERVLCYEPDSRKAKVLYDSKVLEVIPGKDDKGKKTVEYLIHFQGWNSSWDRCVSEDYVLKDTEENRKLQRDLAEKAQLQMSSAYLYRKDQKKKKGSSLSERIFDAGNSCSSREGESVGEECDYFLTTDDDKESSIETDDSLEQTVPLELGPCIRSLLENDFDQVKNQNKLLVLPASPNIVDILEAYVKYYANRIARREGDENCRPVKRRGAEVQQRPTDKAQELEWVCASVNLCKEMADGLRITFDSYVGSLLLYSPEHVQYQTWKTGSKCCPLPVKSEREETVNAEEPSSVGEAVGAGSTEPLDTDRRRSLRSHKDPIIPEPASCTSGANGISNLTIKNLAIAAPHLNHCSPHSTSSNSSYCGPLAGHAAHFNSGSLSPELSKLITLTNSWRLVPDEYLSQRPSPPSTVYGAVHLARLFVKLPTILYSGNIALLPDQPRFLAENKIKVLVDHLTMFLKYLQSNTEWFSEENYVRKEKEES